MTILGMEVFVLHLRVSYLSGIQCLLGKVVIDANTSVGTSAPKADFQTRYMAIGWDSTERWTAAVPDVCHGVTLKELTHQPSERSRI